MSLVNEIISVPTNTVENVTLSAYVYIINGGGSASAHVDPYFAIDPSFADASQYALYFSPGIDNVPISPTPLPAALPMFGAALLAVGGIAWRPQRRTWASGEP